MKIKRTWRDWGEEKYAVSNVRHIMAYVMLCHGMADEARRLFGVQTYSGVKQLAELAGLGKPPRRKRSPLDTLPNHWPPRIAP